MAEAVDNTLMLEILKDIRKEQNNQRTLLLLTVDSVRRLQLFTKQKFLGVEKRFHDVEKRFLDMEERMKAHKDDLEMMLKAELLGAITHFQTRIENYVHERLAEKAEQAFLRCASALRCGSPRRHRSSRETTPWTRINGGLNVIGCDSS